VSQQNLPDEVYKEFLSVIRPLLKGKDKKQRPTDLIDKMLRDTPGPFSLKGRRTPDAEPLSRVMDARSFALYNINNRHFGLEINEIIEDKIWKLFRNGDIHPERHFAGELSSSRNIFWGTPTRRLEPLCGTYQQIRPNEYAVHPPEKADVAATEIRNLLGLSYINEGVRLYRIDIPLKTLEQVKICAPTTLDSSPFCVFLPTDKTTPYGWTLNLTDLKPGAEEVVVEPIKFTADFKVTQIGFVRGPLPNQRRVWKVLAGKVKKRLAKNPL
jgi:hypothetical protein